VHCKPPNVENKPFAQGILFLSQNNLGKINQPKGVFSLYVTKVFVQINCIGTDRTVYLSIKIPKHRKMMSPVLYGSASLVCQLASIDTRSGSVYRKEVSKDLTQKHSALILLFLSRSGATLLLGANE